jgi:hypothetical protein
MMSRAFRYFVMIALGSLATASQAREWHLLEHDERIEADLVEGKAGIVLLKQGDGTTRLVALESLSTTDQAYARRTIGISLLDMTGVWRSESGTYYSAVEGRDGKVYMRSLDSPVFSSIEGVLMRRGNKLVTEQWLLVFKHDPTRQARSGGGELYLSPDGRVFARMEYIYVRNDGTEDKRRRDRKTFSVVRLEGENIPPHIMDAFAKGDRRQRPEDIYNNAIKSMVAVVGITWYADQRKVSLDDLIRGRSKSTTPSVGEIFINALSRSVRNQMITSTINTLFPVYTREERELAFAVIVEYMESRRMLEPLNKAAIEEWTKDRLRVAVAGRPVDPDDMDKMAQFLADVHDRVQRHWVAALPD